MPDRDGISDDIHLIAGCRLDSPSLSKLRKPTDQCFKEPIHRDPDRIDPERERGGRRGDGERYLSPPRH